MALIVLLPENIKLFYTLRLVCLYIKLLDDPDLFKCLIAIKYLEIRVKTLPIFYFSVYLDPKNTKIISKVEDGV